MIELKKIQKSYDSRDNVLSDLSAMIPTGSLSLLYGRSGSGKTTLLNCISGVESFQSGDVYINGEHINGLSDDEKADFRLRNIGIIYQFFNLLPSLTVRENILLPAMILKKNQEDYLLEIADRFEISQLLSKWPDTLSGGECQRVAICRALICKPKLILADEPTGNLDPDLSIQIISLLEKINRAGTTVLMATHDSSIVNRRKKRVLQLKDGKLLSDVDQGRYV